VTVRLPRPLAGLESRARNQVQEALARGKVTMNVAWDPSSVDVASRVVLDADRVARYLELAEQLRATHGATGTLDVKTLLTLPDTIRDVEPDRDLDAWWGHISTGITRAVESLMELKDSEGKALERDILARIDMLDELTGEVEKRAPARIPELRDRLRQRIADILSSGTKGEVDDYRLEQEIAHQADRLDVTEECVRLRAHLDHFRGFVGEESSAGRKLNFLLQEMNREATTIGSKANDAELSAFSVRMKEEIERIREQVQNVE
jgi:uncharacterized protein (TIGR00255 family)